MGGKRPLTSEGARKRAEREREAGLDPEDEAAQWLQQNAPQPAPPAASKSARKSKELHRWRQRQQREGR